jgi:F-box and leucine-rich repeat protein 2/20
MAAVQDNAVAGSVTPMETPGEHTPAVNDASVKIKTRQRLLRGLQRISSSPSLAQIASGRPRAHSSPLRSRGSLSCVNLAAAGPQPHGGDSYFPAGASGSSYASTSSSIPGTPYSGKQSLEGERMTVRRFDPGLATPLTPGAPSVGLPSDLRVTTRSLAAANPAVPPKDFYFWAKMPHELRVYIFSFLQPKELVRASRVSHEFHRLCFDGQLWTSFDASEFYQDIPAESLAKMIVSAGPFIKDLNLRGCVQVEHHKRAEVVVKACRNLINANLEGCRNFQKNTLHTLLRANEKLTTLNLTGLTAVTNITCKIIAESCPQLQKLNVSWCTHMDARGVKAVVKGCPQLTDLRAREIRGFDNIEVAEVIFRTNRLERLILNGCTDLNDRALKIMVHGEDPEIDILTDIPVVPARKWRHLDLSRCDRLTNTGVRALGHLTPDLEGLQLSGCTALTDAALEPVLATTPRLTHLELEDLAPLTNTLLSEHLAKAPCAPLLEHISFSYCENLGDQGMLPVIKNCVSLRNIDLDNTRISDLTLAEAARMVASRTPHNVSPQSRPRVGLHVVVYDCQNVTWTGIREVLFRNAQVKPSRTDVSKHTYPAEIITLKCFYGFQMTVDEHTKRALRGDFPSAGRLERRWADWMQANEEAGATGAGIRRRRRRARAAQALHADEEEGANGGRRRARTLGSCSLM